MRMNVSDATVFCYVILIGVSLSASFAAAETEEYDEDDGLGTGYTPIDVNGTLVKQLAKEAVRKINKGVPDLKLYVFSKITDAGEKKDGDAMKYYLGIVVECPGDPSCSSEELNKVRCDVNILRQTGKKDKIEVGSCVTYH